MPSCAADTAREVLCRDGKAASHLKLMSIFIIFFTSVFGISLPIFLARLFQGKPAYDKAVLIIKCFAAGVILSTSLVHVLPDAFTALADCQVSSLHPWKDFPFSGLVTLIGVLLALSVDLTATSHVHNQQQQHDHHDDVTSPCDGGNEYKHVDVAKHHQQQHDDDGFELPESTAIVDVGNNCHNKYERLEKLGVVLEEEEEEEVVKLKQRLVSQVLEIGIIFHSVIIGVTMGMSQNKCTIRPLVAALAFHQIFEGMGLGGCIAQAGFSLGTTAYMCFMFSVTTPMGIILGMVVFSVTGYDDHSRNALIIEGLLGSLSSGILIYMALVDLIALDFFHNKLMSSEAILKKASFVALVLGSTSMSILALWA